MSHRPALVPPGAPTGLAGFPPPVPILRACVADVLIGLTRLSNAGQRQPAKGAPSLRTGQLPVALRPSRNRVRALAHRLATVGLAGIGLALVWQLTDHHSLLRTSLSSFRLRLRRRLGRPTTFRSSLPAVIRKKLGKVRR